MLHVGSEEIPAQLLVGAAGLWIMTIIAYYRTWSKEVDRELGATAMVKGPPGEG